MTISNQYYTLKRPTCIKHRLMNDIAFIAIKITEDTEQYKVFGYWLNIVNKPHTLMGNEHIVIQKQDADDWHPYS